MKHLSFMTTEEAKRLKPGEVVKFECVNADNGKRERGTAEVFYSGPPKPGTPTEDSDWEVDAQDHRGVYVVRVWPDIVYDGMRARHKAVQSN